MLWNLQRVSDVLQDPQFRRMRDVLLAQTIPAICRAIGDDRLAWLRSLPIQWTNETLAVVHAGADDPWVSPMLNAPDDELEQTYGRLARPCVVYGHIHQPYVRRLHGFTVANAGSVSLSYDGDPRASYALIDEGQVVIRRVPYDVEEEARRLVDTGYPDGEWLAQILRSARYLPPPV